MGVPEYAAGAGGPRIPGPARWRFPDPAHADAEGIVGLGADLAAETLVHAYREGIFPWPHPGMPLPWFSPDPRGVLRPEEVRVPRSLRRSLRRSGWETTVDRAFGAVISACAEPRGEVGTWITARMRTAYWRLHQLGWAHSVEVWSGDELVGGLYGVQLGAVFTGESMFHRASDASKVALVDLADRFHAAGGVLIDVQLTTDHLAMLGAHDVPRAEFLRLLATLRDHDVALAEDRRPVARLTSGPPPATRP